MYFDMTGSRANILLRGQTPKSTQAYAHHPPGSPVVSPRDDHGERLVFSIFRSEPRKTLRIFLPDRK
jgi:hypothetical protein